jgi:electron transfer flavoprotein beta subunit
VRILTVIRPVPDSSATVRLAGDGTRIDADHVNFVMNPFDEYAVEQAVRLREQGLPVEEIAALALGGEKAKSLLRIALAVGADRGVLLDDPVFDSHDEVFLSHVVALALRRQRLSFDLVLTGKQAIDTDSGELGPALAEQLDWPHVGAVCGLDATDRGVRTRRRVDGAEEVMECPLPVLLTCEKGLAELRYPAMSNLARARKKPVETVTAGDLPGLGRACTRILALEPVPAREPCRWVEGEPAEMARELVRLLREEARVI